MKNIIENSDIGVFEKLIKELEDVELSDKKKTTISTSSSNPLKTWNMQIQVIYLLWKTFCKVMLDNGYKMWLVLSLIKKSIYFAQSTGM